MKKLSIVLFTMLLIFSCKKKDETVDTCQNGFIDAGEELPDCGGPCPPCETNYTSSLYVKLNGVSTTFTTKSLSYNGTNWILSMTNDSLDLQIDLGSNGAVGTYSISAINSNCDYFGINYPILSEGSCAINYHDTGAQRMSGFFSAKFSRPGFVDTVRITNGQFDYFTY